MKTKFYTKFSIEECIQRLKMNTRKNIFGINTYWSTLVFGDFEKKYYLSVNRNKLKLERVYNRNIYRPIFIAEFIKDNNGTKIEGQIKRSKFAKIIKVLWFTFAGIIGGLAIFTSIIDLFNHKKVSSEAVISIILPLFLMIFGIFIIKAMKQQALQWEKEMINFIEDTLEAKIQAK